MTKKRVTITDVAKAAGVSVGTVSRVLNKRTTEIKISDATKKHVLQTAAEMGYKRNIFASALRTQQTGVIGAIVRDINDPFLSLIARQLQKVAHKNKVELVLGHAEYDRHTAERQLYVMGEWFDSLLIIGDMLGHRAAISKVNHVDFTQNGYDHLARNSTPLVSIDDDNGTRLGMEHLISLGHRRIAFIGNVEYAGIKQRFDAFREIVQKENLYWDDAYYQPCANKRKLAAECTETLLNLPEPPTAIFCMADLLAVSAMTTAWNSGLNVPRDLSVIGFDDIEEAETSFPPLTTLGQPVHDMVDQAFSLLQSLNAEEGEESPKRDDLPIVFKPQLIIRGSTASPNI